MTHTTHSPAEEIQQLRRRIDLLAEENRTLRELADPSAGAIELQAENILLQREAGELEELVGRLTPFAGALPQTLEAFAALPAAHQAQIARDRPDHIDALRQVEQLLAHAAENDRAESIRREQLTGAPAGSPQEFDALTESDRLAAALSMNGDQRRAMCGLAAMHSDEAYL